MKVLVVAHEPNFCGGANRSLFSNLCELKFKYGVEFLVVIPSKKSLLGKKLDEVGIRWIPIKYFGVISGIRGDSKDILRYLKTKIGYYIEKVQAIRLFKKIKRENVDVVYTNTRLPIIGAEVAKRLNVPHVIHVRELGAEKPLWGKWGFKEIEKKSNKIILISEALKKQFVANDVDESKIIVSHNGIQYEAPILKNKNLENEINLILVGRLVPDKGHEDAIRALKYIIDLKKYSNKKIKLHIVGSSPQRMHISWYEKKMKLLVSELGLDENVIFTGEINNIAEYRKNMHIELVCSINETFGRVTVEAMRSGLLVIGSNTGGTVELIKHKEDGMLYKQGDANDLAEKIIEIIDNETLYKKLVLEAYNKAKNNYTVEKNCYDIYSVLKSCAKEKENK